MADYSKKLRDMQETVEQSDSGMTRSDETKGRLRDLAERIRQSESAGAGRGGQGGPTAKELKKHEDKLDAGVFTKEKRMPPSPREMASGGKVGAASKRADGCATKGKTKGTMVKMAMGGRTC
jgi:hypothetical protein